jgi:hypothetical protein
MHLPRFLRWALAASLVAVLPFNVSSARGQSESDPVQAFRVDAEHYALRSHAWLNLHHFLYQWACTEKEERRCASRIRVAEKSDRPQLSPSEAEAWDQALGAYRSIADRSLLFDDEMIDVKEILRRKPSVVQESLDTVPLGLGEALRLAMPVYRAHWWSKHNRANQAWIETTATVLQNEERSAVTQMEQVYGGNWPSTPVLVDVGPYANWSGAYTTVRPVHVSMARASLEAGSARALEVVFHEGAHGRYMVGPLEETLDAAFSSYDAASPRRLWHSVIFFVAGEVTRRASFVDKETFEPHWTRISGFQRSDRAAEFRALEKTLTPLFNQELDRDVAFDELAKMLVKHSAQNTTDSRKRE